MVAAGRPNQLGSSAGLTDFQNKYSTGDGVGGRMSPGQNINVVSVITKLLFSVG